MKMLVEVIVTRRGKVYVRIFTRRRSLFYEQVEGGLFEPCLPQPPGSLAMAQVKQHTF